MGVIKMSNTKTSHKGDTNIYYKSKKLHCVALETKGTKACYTCPYPDCICTAPCTKRESAENNDILYSVGIAVNTGGKYR